MLIKLTLDELKCHALRNMGLAAELRYHSSGLAILDTPHKIEIIASGQEELLEGCKFIAGALQVPENG